MSLSLDIAAQTHFSVDELLSSAHFHYQLSRTPMPNRFLRPRTLSPALDEPVNVKKESGGSGESSSEGKRTFRIKATNPPDVTTHHVVKHQRNYSRPPVFNVTRKANSWYDQPGCSSIANHEAHKDRFQYLVPRVIFGGDSEALLPKLKAPRRQVDYEVEELTLDHAILEAGRHCQANQGRNKSNLQETLERSSQQNETAGKDTKPAIDNYSPQTLLHHGDQARFLASEALSRIKDHTTRDVTNLEIPKSPPQQPLLPIRRRVLPPLAVAKDLQATQRNKFSTQPSRKGLERPSTRRPLTALKGQQPQVSLSTPSTSKRVVETENDESPRNPKRRRAARHLPVDELELSADKFFAIPENPESDSEDLDNDPVEEQIVDHLRPSSRIANLRKQRKNLFSATRISYRTATKKVYKDSVEALSGFKVLPPVVEVGRKLSPKMAVSDGFELAELQPSVRTKLKASSRKQKGSGRMLKVTSLRYFAQLEILEDGVPKNHSNTADFRQNHAPRGGTVPRHESKKHEDLTDADVHPSVAIAVPSDSFAANEEPGAMPMKTQPMILWGHQEVPLVYQQAILEPPLSSHAYKPLAQRLLVYEVEAPEDAKELDPDSDAFLSRAETKPAIQHTLAEDGIKDSQRVNSTVAIWEQVLAPSSRIIYHPDTEVIDDESVGKMVQSAKVQHNTDGMEVEMQVDVGVDKARQPRDDPEPPKLVVKGKLQVTFSEEVKLTTITYDYTSTTESEDETETETESNHDSESESEGASDDWEEGEDEEVESDDEEMELPEDEIVTEDRDQDEAEEELMTIPENGVATEAEEADESETDHDSDRHSKSFSPELVSSRYSKIEVPENSQPGVLEDVEDNSDDRTQSELQNDEVQPNGNDAMALDDIQDDGPQNQETQLIGRGDLHGTGVTEDDMLINAPQTPVRWPVDADLPISWSFMRELVARANLDSDVAIADCPDDEGYRSVRAAHVDLALGVFNEDFSGNEDDDEVLARITSSLRNTSCLRKVLNSTERAFAGRISPVIFGNARVVHLPTEPAFPNEVFVQPRSGVLAKRSKTNVARDCLRSSIAGQTVSSKPNATPSTTSLEKDGEVKKLNTCREGPSTPRQPLKAKRSKIGRAVPVVPSFTQAPQQLFFGSFGADMNTMVRRAKTLPTGTCV